MELRHYFAALWKRVSLLILAPLLAGTIGLVFSMQIEPVYQVSTTLLINPAERTTDLDYSSLLSVERIGNTFAELLTSRSLLKQIIDDLNLPLSYRELSSKINVTQPVNTQLLKILVEDSDPRMAVEIANNLAATFEKEISQRQIGQSFNVEVVELAALPARQVQPKPVMSTLVASFAGLVLGLSLVLLLDHLDLTFSRPEDVEMALQVPTLATIPSIRTRTSDSVGTMAASKPASPFSEAYRMVRTNLMLTNADSAVKSLLVTSSLALEGKTTTAANLGVVMAQAGLRVLLVDADLRRASLHTAFNLPNQKGLSDLLQTDLALDESFLLETTVPNLYLLPAGSWAVKPSELLGSERMTELIDQMVDRSEIVLFDSSPIMVVTDGALLSTRVDGVLLVVEANRTSKNIVQRTLGTLKTVDANVLGTILNRSKSGNTYYYQRNESKAERTTGVRAPRLGAVDWRRWIPFLSSNMPEDSV